MERILRKTPCALLLILFAFPVSAADLRGGDRLAYALAGGRVIAAPGLVIDPGVVVIRGGVIEAVGPVGATAIRPTPESSTSPLDLPQREDEPYDTQFANAGRLEKAGVRVLFNDGGADASNVRNYPHLAATAVAFGFPREKAIAAMTLEPATLLGVADRVGSLSPGKDATFIVTDGDILDLRSHVVAAYLDGRPLDLSDKQKRLYEKYRNRPRPAPAPTATAR